MAHWLNWDLGIALICGGIPPHTPGAPDFPIVRHNYCRCLIALSLCVSTNELEFMAKFDLRRMERDILQVVRDIGDLRPRYQSISPAMEFLIEKYIDQNDSWHSNQQLTVLIDYLVEKRFLFPVYTTKGEVSSGFARGITPKGLTRLRELQTPRWWHWVKGNWFPVIVAVITAGVGIASIIVDVTCNRG